MSVSSLVLSIVLTGTFAHLIGCKRDPDPASSSDPKDNVPPEVHATLHSQPEDLGTDVSTGPVRLIVWAHSPPSIERERFTRLTESIFAESQGVPLAVDARVVQNVEPDISGFIQGPNAIEILPVNGSWPSEWVTISVEAEQWGWFAPYLAHRAAEDGIETLSWRFRPDSHPTLQRVEFCAGQSHTLVRFHLSELPREPLELGHTGVYQPRATCSPAPPEDGVSRHISLTCTDFSWNDPVNVVFDQGLIAHNGQPYAIGTTDARGVDTDVVLTRLVPRQDSCVELRFP